MRTHRAIIVAALACAAAAHAQSRVLVLSSSDPVLDNTVLAALTSGTGGTVPADGSG